MVDSQFKANVIKNISIPTFSEQIEAKARIRLYLSLIKKYKKIDTNSYSLAELIKFLSLMPASSRFISGIFYPKKHPEHEDQYSGRDLKRWAAIELSELFDDSAMVKEHRFPNFVGEYWHEF